MRQVKQEHLRIVTGRSNPASSTGMTTLLASPSERTQPPVATAAAALGPLMSLELGNRLTRTAHIEHHGTFIADSKRGEVVLFLCGEGDARKRTCVGGFIQDCRMFQTPQIECA